MPSDRICGLDHGSSALNQNTESNMRLGKCHEHKNKLSVFTKKKIRQMLDVQLETIKISKEKRPAFEVINLLLNCYITEKTSFKHTSDLSQL